jgi:hypothetical protein
MQEEMYMQWKNVKQNAIRKIANFEFQKNISIEFQSTDPLLSQQCVFLWFQDQYETVALHTQKGIDFLEKYGHFIRDRCAIELDYAGKLR